METVSFGKASLVRAFESLAELRVDQLKEYVDLIRSALANEATELAERVEKSASELLPADRQDHYEWYLDDFWQLNEVFPAMLFNSSMVAIYSYFEHTLLDLCRLLERDRPLGRLSDYAKDTGIVLARKYLVNTQGIAFPDRTDWQRVHQYRKTRDFIVHNNAAINGTPKGEAVRMFATDNPELLSIKDRGRIATTAEACHDLADTVTTILKEVFDAASEVEGDGPGRP